MGLAALAAAVPLVAQPPLRPRYAVRRPQTVATARPLVPTWVSGWRGRSAGEVDVSRLPGPQSEATVAVNPLNANNVIAGCNDLASPACLAFASPDGGKTWVSNALPLPAVSSEATDPSIVFDRNGVAYFCYIEVHQSGARSRILVARSGDGGATWEADPIRVTEFGAYFEDKTFIGIGPDRLNPARDALFVAWTRLNLDGSQQLLVTRSADGGETWTDPARIDDATAPGNGVIYAQPAVAVDGTVYVVWNEYGSPNFIRVARSDDGGATWQPSRVVGEVQLNLFEGDSGSYLIPAQPQRGIAASPSIGVDRSVGPRRGSVYVSWSDTASSHDDTDVFIRGSGDGGQTWGPILRVNDDRTMRSQFFPWMAVDPVNGAVNLCWYDCRRDRRNRAAHVFLARYADGLVARVRNMQVTSQPSNEAKRNADVNNYGDYLGIAAQGGIVYPCWTDSRTLKKLGEEIWVRRMVFP
ncbi:MAG: exo-alpha-sialidase [Armatimonadetes bacterium]|nr:exo-alpha-sialidase [Armatimonadota bacterium]